MINQINYSETSIFYQMNLIEHHCTCKNRVVIATQKLEPIFNTKFFQNILIITDTGVVRFQ